MAELIIVLMGVVVALVCVVCIVFGDDWLEAWRARRESDADAKGTWQVAERTNGMYMTVGCRRTVRGAETHWIEVASIPHNDPEWDEKLLTARAVAAQRRERLEARS